ncbi:MAG: PD-(D/E)XK nuclease family protein [Mariprofundaceae bacterium]
MNTNIKLELQALSTSEAISRLTEGAQLITASAALSADWKRRYIHAIDTPVCETPQVYSWSAWVSEHFRQHNHATCLNPLQEKLLWEKVIRADMPDATNASIRGLARHASHAYTFMQKYHIQPDELDFNGEEAAAFKGWLLSLESTLNKSDFKGRILSAHMPQEILQTISAVNFSQHIILDGFESFSPEQQQLFNALAEMGVHFYNIQAEQQHVDISLTSCPDEASELHHMATRTSELLSRDQETRIAILTTVSMPDHASLQRMMNHTLMPESIVSPHMEIQAIAIPGEPLSNWPMIQHVLHLLSLLTKPSISFDDFSILLFNPWTHEFDSERLQRAELDALFRRQNRHKISLKGLLKSSYIQTLPALFSVIEIITQWQTHQRPINQWIKDIHALLQKLGLIQAGLEHESSRSNIEIRQMNAFRDVLTSLIAIEVLHSHLSWSQCLSLLRTSCSESYLALPAKYPNVIVMPFSQVAGLSFDHVLVMNMDEISFPPATQSQALLPIRLQQKYNIPMSHASLIFESSRWLWDQLKCVSPHIEISYASQRDEQKTLPSPFVSTLSPQSPCISNTQPSQLQLESFDDALNVPVQNNEIIRGGTSIIRHQSACPFRAFAIHRLGIKQLGETTPGIEASSKGSLIHLALEFIWKYLKSQSALLALNDIQKEELIADAIKHAWQHNRSSTDMDTQHFEKIRMQRILHAWLTLESTRPDFDVIATEKKYYLQLPEHSEQQLSLNITADRMDQDAEGHRVLIDYKTGAKQSSSKWLGQRIEDPQLPLYAIAAKISGHDAVAFACVRSGNDMGFEGLSAENIGIDGLTLCDGKRNRPDDWQAVLNEWKVQMNDLAQEFIDGCSDVSPRDKKACLHCGLEAVCRIEEKGFTIDMDDET